MIYQSTVSTITRVSCLEDDPIFVGPSAAIDPSVLHDGKFDQGSSLGGAVWKGEVLFVFELLGIASFNDRA